MSSQNRVTVDFFTLVSVEPRVFSSKHALLKDRQDCYEVRPSCCALRNVVGNSPGNVVCICVCLMFIYRPLTDLENQPLIAILISRAMHEPSGIVMQNDTCSEIHTYIYGFSEQHIRTLLIVEFRSHTN